MPWLVLYAINIVLLVVVSIYMFINPIPVFTTESAHYELLRLFGLVPLAAALLLGKLIIDTILDFLCKLGIKPHMHLVEIRIFSLNNIIVRLHTAL